MDELLTTLSRFTSWDRLRRLPANKIIASSYIWIVIVPVVAKIFSRVQETIVIGLNENKIEILLALPFSWKLFFFSALCFTVGNVIFSIFCPYAIKRYSNYDEFIMGGGDFSDLIFLKRDLPIDKKTEFEVRETNSSKNGLDVMFWFSYKGVREIKFICRLIISFFYVVGFSLFSIVALSNIWWVIGSGYVF